MRCDRSSRTMVLVLAAAAIGYLVGPPVAQAVSQLVTVKSGTKNNEARVTARRLWVDPGPPPAADDPDKIFSVVAFHSYMFDNDPDEGLVGKEVKDAHDPCAGLTPTPSHIVVTGLDISQSTGPGIGVLDHVDLDEASAAGGEIQRFFQYHPTGFHDDSGLAMDGQSSFLVTTFMRGAAQKVCTPACALVPVTFHVPIVVYGYCVN